MSVRLGVVAHTSRAEQAHALQEQVQAVYLSMDNGALGCNANHCKVWTWLSEHPGDADWLVVMEDDCVPVPDFNDQLGMILDAAPTDVVSLYLGSGRPPAWQDRVLKALTAAEAIDAHFALCRKCLHGVAVAIRTHHVPDLLEYLNNTNQPVDYSIGDWADINNIPVSYPIPSICDHLDTPTLFEHPDRLPRTTPRKAHRVGSRDEWTNRTVMMR